MNKLNILNKLRKRRLDRERKRNIKKRHKKIIRQINECYLKEQSIDFGVSEYIDPIFSRRVTFKEYEFIKKYLNDLSIKYKETINPTYVQKNTPFSSRFEFIYEEETNE